MQRIPEPELMNDPGQAKAYAEADFSEANILFLRLFQQYFPGIQPLKILDLGCGPGDITVAFAKCFPGSRIWGVDGAEAMLEFARQKTRNDPNLGRRVCWLQARIPADIGGGDFDGLISNSLLHHLDNPSVLWRAILEYGRSGAAVLVMDLFRPDNHQTAKTLVEQYAADAPAVLQRDFLNSLCAAYSPQEIEQQLEQAGLDGLTVEIVSDRHVAVHGVLK